MNEPLTQKSDFSFKITSCPHWSIFIGHQIFGQIILSMYRTGNAHNCCQLHQCLVVFFSIECM